MPRSRIMSLAVVTASLLVVIALANIATSGADDTAAEGLRDRIEDLEQRVVELETRLTELQARQPIVQLGGPAAPVAGPYNTILSPPPNYRPSMPRGTQQGEINGIPFYIIPLQDTTTAPPAPAE